MLISEIIETRVINQLDTSLEVLEFGNVVNDTQEVRFCNDKWVKLFGLVYVDGVGVPVNSYNSENGTIILDVTAPNQIVSFASVVTLDRPKFFNGTLSNTRLEWDKFSLDEREKLPFIWLVSPTTERVNNKDTGISRESDLTLWFVHWSDWSKLNIDRQSEAVAPLMALKDEFVKTIERLTHIFEGYDNYSQKDFPKFGTETPSGTDRTLFNTTLSAIEVILSVKIFARYCEKC